MKDVRERILAIAGRQTTAQALLLIFANRCSGQPSTSPFKLTPQQRQKRLKGVLAALGAGDLQKLLTTAEGLERVAASDKQKEEDRKSKKKFADDHLQLAALSGLLQERRVPPLDEQKLKAAERAGAREEDDDDGSGYNRAVAELLLRIDLPDAAIATLREIVWTDDRLVPRVFPQWPGDEREFDVKSLGGIERCRSLESLSLSFSNAVRDLRPLRGCTKLRTLDLSGGAVSNLKPLSGLVSLERIHLTGCPVRDLTPLLELPKLKRVTIDWRTEPKTKKAPSARRADERAAALLEKRGVLIREK